MNNNQVIVDGRVIFKTIHIAKPNITVFDNFLSNDECNKIIDYCKQNDEEKKNNLFYNIINNKINTRVKSIVDFNIEIENKTQFFLDTHGHGKCFCGFDDCADTNVENRVGIVNIYLNSVTSGGNTEIFNTGINIVPKKGSVLLFLYPENKTEDNTSFIDKLVLSGEKWSGYKFLTRSLQNVKNTNQVK